MAIKQLFGDADLDSEEILVETEEELVSAQTPEFDTNNSVIDETGSEDPKSGVGSAIKAVAICVIILSAIGSCVMMSELEIVVGIATLIVSLLFGLVAFGIGEICTLLTRMDSRLEELQGR